MDIEYNEQYEVEKGGSKRRQHCTYCKNHGFHYLKTNHKCQYETCKCILCELTRLSRLVMRHQQRLWRHLKDTKRRENIAESCSGVGSGVVPVNGGSGGGSGGSGDDPGVSSVTGGDPGLGVSSKQQKCDMCRNHGMMVEKRAHKNACPYQTCVCALCGLTKKRRDIMRHQQRVRRSQVTSQQRDEAYDYVMQTTAELAQLSNDSTPVVKVTPTNTKATTTPMTAMPPPATPEVLETVPPPTCSTYSPISCSTDTFTTSSPDSRNLRKPRPLEVVENSLPLPCLGKPLVVSDPRTPAFLGPGLCSDASLLDAGEYQTSLDNARLSFSLKRERQEMDSKRPRLSSETSHFRNFEFVRSNNNLMVRDEAMRNVESIYAYDSVNRMELGTNHDLPFVPSLVEGVLPRTASSKKTHLPLTNEDLYYSHRFLGANPVDISMNLASNNQQQVNYHRIPTNGSPEVRMRPLPELIPLRPQPLRHPTIRPSMEWNPTNLPYLAAYSLVQTSTYNPSIPTTPFDLGRVSPILYPSVP